MSEVIEEIDEADELAPLHAQIAAALPASWTLETLGSLCEKSQYGWTTKADKAGSGVKFLRTTDITPGVVDWSSVPYCVEAPSDLEKYLIKDGDILISRTGSIGVNYLVVKPEPAVFASYLIRFRPKTSISTKYLKYYLQSPAYWRAINTGKKGIAVQNVNATMLSRIPVPVAPPAVQDEIVAELEKQFSRLDEAVANLQRVKANLKRYKASVLKAAVEGRLVETEGGWRQSTLGEEGAIIGGLTKNQKRNDLPLKLPYLRVANVYANELRLDEIEYIGVAEKELAKLLVRKGDLLVVEGNGSPDQIGRVALWNDAIPNCVHQNHLIKVRFGVDVLPEWALIWMLSPVGRHEIEQVSASTSGLHTLSVGKVSRLPIGVPPLQEQSRIVTEVDRHLSIIREVEAEVDANLQRAQALRQATLAKAFSP